MIMHCTLFPPAPTPLGKPLCWALYLPPPVQTNSPRLNRHTNKYLLNYTFCKRASEKVYNQGMKVQVTTKDIKKGDRA